MSRVFDKYELMGAYHWDWYENPLYAWYKECVDRMVDFCKGSTLELGCGEAVLGSLIAEKGYEYVGYDSSHTAVELAHPDLDVRYSDIEGPAVWDMELEYLACMNTIEHLKSSEILKHIIRNCISKGAIIITDEATGHLGRYHEHEYSLEELVETFKEFNPTPFSIHSTEHGKPITFIGIEIRK